MTYYSKYLKYKNKYLELKNMIGGYFKGNEKELDNLWNKRNSVGKVFPITYQEFKTFYSHYCWISGPAYGTGFFLYRLKPGQQPVNGHVKNTNDSKYALFHITENNIGESGTRTTAVPDEFFKNSYKTTIDLTNIPRGTAFDWLHDATTGGVWVYNTNPIRTYSLKL